MFFGSPALILLALVSSSVHAANVTASIDPKLTYLLPPKYIGELQQNFIDTNTTNNSENAQLAAAQKAPFISYDPEFTAIIGQNPTLRLVAEREAPFADEAGVWVSDRNEVWFTSSVVNNQSHLMVLDLETSEIYTPKTSIPVVNPNGGYYYNGTVYVAGTGTFTEAPCIYGITPSTGETTVILNTYFGLQFNGPNDITWVQRGNKSYMFFTDDPIAERYAPGSGTPSQLPDAVWRFDPQEHSLVPVTDSSATDAFPNLQGGAGGTGSPAIFVFDLDDDAFPVNKRMVGISRSGVPDGIHIDDADRIWTGEYEGIVVRNAQGKVLGLFNSEATVATPGTHLQNFALAGDTLVLLDIQRLWTLKLAQRVVSPGRFEIQ